MTMMICHDLRNGTGCGAHNRDGAQHCRSCGRSLRFALTLRDPGARVAQYRIRGVIGHGGFGVVYEAEDMQRHGLVVALKETFDPESIRSFANEFRVLQQLNHPNLPHYYAMFEAEGNGFLVMEYIPGQSLDDVLSRRPGPLLESQVMGYALQICDALIYLHSQQPPIIHGDIKPANIRLTPEGLVKLVDFGLLKEGSQQTRNSRRGLTPAYAPIEQWSIGVRGADPRSDVYSLGATLFHLLTGQEPPPVTDRIAGPYDPLPPVIQLNPNISGHVALAIWTAMEIQADKRYPDIASLKRALQGVAPALVEQPGDLPMAYASVSWQSLVEAAPPAAFAPQAAAVTTTGPAPGDTIVLPQPQPTAGPATSPPLPTTLTIPGLNALGASLASVALISGSIMGGALELISEEALELVFEVPELIFRALELVFEAPGLVFVSWIASVLASWYIYRQRGGNPWIVALLALLLNAIAPIVVIWTLFLWPKHAQPAPRPVHRPWLHLVLGLGSLAAIPLVVSTPELALFAWYGWILVAEYMFVSKGRRNIAMALTAMLTGPIGVVIAWLTPPRRVAP